VREPQHPIAGEREGGVALAIALERRSAAVIRPAIGDDDDALPGEQEVDLEAGDGRVDERLGQPMGAADRELRSSSSLFVTVEPGVCSPKARRPAVSGVGVGDPHRGPHVRQARARSAYG
jgi:hypothetical protein